MPYEPREGVDYLVDLYAVAAAPRDADADALKSSINQRLTEYHPDRLHGLADEFQQKGERMVRLLNRAKGILLDDEKRQGYDDLLNEWDGPLSTDGTPVIEMDRYLRAELRTKTPDEVEATLAGHIAGVETVIGYSPDRLSFLERMLAQVGDEVPDDLRAQYDDALLQRDLVLAISENQRALLLGLPDTSETHYEVAPGYAQTVAAAIETARAQQLEDLRLQAIGGVTTRLAILAGEAAPETAIQPAVETPVALPAYYELQVDKITAVVAEREAVLAKRLANFRLQYPDAESQPEPLAHLAIGVQDETVRWYRATFDPETKHASVDFVDPEVAALLESGNFSAAFARGYNVVTFAMLERVDITAMLTHALQMHATKYGIYKP